MDRLRKERDAALEQVIYWRERAVGTEGERDALAARLERHSMDAGHAEQRRAESRAVREALGFGADADDVSPRDLLDALARLKAQWQAEVLYEFTHGSYVMPATLNLAMCKRAGELRRQAE
jgi:hypothetical protein